tara:strand:- start:310 stop:468 length:159 start_codon:yes stop_codon:yes gene_type:complete
MKFKVTLIEHEEGVSISCPALPDCPSQGATREETLDNIREWLVVAQIDHQLM